MDITWKDIKLRIGWTTKTDLYVFVSYVMLVVLLSTNIYDFILVLVEESPQDSTQLYTLAILLLNTMAFYLGFISYVYTTQTSGHRTAKVYSALGATFGNLAVFIMRATYEIVFLGYREEYYRTSGDR